MTFDTQKFARKYALRYTVILAVFLIVPLVIYIRLLLQIDDAKVKLSLKQQAQSIIHLMQGFDNSDKVFHFPRYKEYDTALYNAKYQEIFSTLDFKPNAFTEGFHKKDAHYYYLYPLPEGYYFASSYLLVSTKHTANDIYYFAASVMFIIVLVLFFLSVLLLRNFSTPFERLNSQLDNFIKDSMHEINTPLSIISLNVDLFAHKYGDNKYLQRMKSASKTLATIYNDMDFLIKQGRVEHHEQEIDLSHFVQSRADYFQEIANLKNIQLQLDIKNNIFYTFSKTKLQRIVDNTISNAIKYSNDNTQVDISLYQDKEKIFFTVEDYGVGIEDVNKIFSRYYREDETKGGFGIGLNIIKKIIDESSIEIEVKSSIGTGTIFQYKL